MTDDTHRSVHLTRTGPYEYQARNPRGGVVTFGEGQNADFTPVELLLAALGGCQAVTVEALTMKRTEATVFEVAVDAEKVMDEQGSHLVDLRVTFDVVFPDDDQGRRSVERLPDAMAKSHDKYCTVSRTIALAPAIEMLRTNRPDLG